MSLKHVTTQYAAFIAAVKAAQADAIQRNEHKEMGAMAEALRHIEEDTRTILQNAQGQLNAAAYAARRG